MTDKYSLHISKRECECKCGCGLNRMSDKIIDRAEIARAMVNYIYNMQNAFNCGRQLGARNRLPEPIEIKLFITSGTRCQTHNDKPQKKGGAGGSKNSEHVVETVPSCDGNELFALNDCKAIDGYFYYTSNNKHVRVNASEVLIYMWEMELINGLVLYDNYRFHISTGRRYSSWKDKRSV